MLNFREFQAGPDPFGRSFHVLMKWMQTAISIRHSDTVDVKFIMESDEARAEKTISMSHAALLKLSRESGHELNDAWCSRLAALHLRRLIETGEDMEKDLVSPALEQMESYAAVLARAEKAAIQGPQKRGAA